MKACYNTTLIKDTVSVTTLLRRRRKEKRKKKGEEKKSSMLICYNTVQMKPECYYDTDEIQHVNMLHR